MPEIPRISLPERVSEHLREGIRFPPESHPGGPVRKGEAADQTQVD